MSSRSLAGYGRIYLTRCDLEVIRLAYPDSEVPFVPTWKFLTPRVAKAYASCLERWANMNADDDLSTVAIMLAGDMRALDAS